MSLVRSAPRPHAPLHRWSRRRQDIRCLAVLCRHALRPKLTRMQSAARISGVRVVHRLTSSG